MSYSLTMMNLGEESDWIAAALEQADAASYTEEDAAPGVRDRISKCAETAYELMHDLGIEPPVNLSLSGHVKQSEDDLAGDHCNISITAHGQVVT